MHENITNHSKSKHKKINSNSKARKHLLHFRSECEFTISLKYSQKQHTHQQQKEKFIINDDEVLMINAINITQ